MKKLIVAITIVLITTLSTGCQKQEPQINTLPVVEIDLPIPTETEIQESQESSGANKPSSESETTAPEPSAVEEEPTTPEETLPLEPETTVPEPEPETTAPVEETTEPAPVYTFTEIEGKVMYPISSVNVRTLPSTDGEIVCVRYMNEEVWVTARCNETGWYRIMIEGQTFYMSDSYLSETKVVPPTTQSPKPQRPTYSTTGFVYYTVAGRWPERAYEEYLYSCLVDRGIAWWYPYAIAQIWAESCWTPTSYNGVDAGICQFNEKMFPARAAHHANYPDADVWNPYDSLYVYSFYIRDILVGCNYDIEAAWSYYIKGHWNDRHEVYINACWKWYNALEAK